MFLRLFIQAARSRGRQRAFRTAVSAHLAVLAAGAWAVTNGWPVASLGHLVLAAAIVEGAALVGWRPSQLPKTQALEFLLVSPVRPARLFLGEALVGLTRLALLTAAGLPVLLLLQAEGHLAPADLPPLLAMPFTWGALTGIGLTAWAYEPLRIRRWAERAALGLVGVYLGIGLVAGEHLRDWVAWLPADGGRWFLNGFEAFHRYNPFAVLAYWLAEGPDAARERAVGLEAAGLGALLLATARAAGRLKGHFHELHYRPAADGQRRWRPVIGERPLSWWAVRRVTRYSGRVNLWLAAGFGGVYALYTVAEPWWPPWAGRRVFDLFDQMGGIPGLATALVVLAAVPAAFQYGLWDSNAHERCRRLELLLLTRLQPEDYWHAATAAAWRRGRGYFAVAVLLWAAAAVAGRLAMVQLVGALAAGVVLWGLYFAVGFRAFVRGLQANGLGLLLTVGLPLASYGLYRAGWPVLGGLVPAGSVYGAAAGRWPWEWLGGPLAGGFLALALARSALGRCDLDLRRWYDRHHGRKAWD
jgi:hypothetical protein